MKRPPFFIISALGNPEPQYALTRHNAGIFMAKLLQGVAPYPDKPWRALNGSKVTYSNNENCIMLRADGNYINLSGHTLKPVWPKLNAKFGEKYNVVHVVLHDELSQDLGVCKIRQPGASPRGHNGLKDIHKVLGDDFYRIPIGIGRPESREPKTVADYVLGKHTRRELDVLETEGLHSLLECIEKIKKMAVK